MIPYMPKPERRLRRGCGCLAAIVFAPVAFGLVSIMSNKLEPFLPVIVGLLVAIAGFFIWFSRQR